MHVELWSYLVASPVDPLLVNPDCCSCEGILFFAFHLQK